MTAFSSRTGWHYATFTHQVGGFQHRYLVPLFDSRVVQCFEEVCGEGALGYSLAGENDQAVVWRSVLGPRGFMPVKALCGTVPEGQEEQVLEEYSTVLREARGPERIPMRSLLRLRSSLSSEEEVRLLFEHHSGNEWDRENMRVQEPRAAVRFDRIDVVTELSPEPGLSSSALGELRSLLRPR